MTEAPAAASRARAAQRVPPAAVEVESRCRACGHATLDTFLSLGELPLSDGLLTREQLDRPEPRYPLDVALCRGCALVQILKTVPPEELFGSDYPYYSSYSDTLLAHSAANVEARIAGCGLGSRSLVVELASNDGYLLQYYRARGIPVLGIDPAPGPVASARSRGIDTLQAFFGRELAAELAAKRRADVIHGNNVLAHVADTNGFVAGIATLLAPDGLAVLEVPYVRELIEHGEFDTIYHEHLCYFSVSALVPLFRSHGLELVRVEPLAIHGGSLRLFVRHRGAQVEDSVMRLLEAENAAGMRQIAYFQRFAARVQSIRDGLGRLLRELKAQRARIAGYGAAAKGTILLNYVGVGPETLDYVVDRNPHKQGRYIPGVRIPIDAPERVLAEQPDFLLILPWNLREEIMAQQSEYRRRGGRFIVPVPEPQVLA